MGNNCRIKCAVITTSKTSSEAKNAIKTFQSG